MKTPMIVKAEGMKIETKVLMDLKVVFIFFRKTALICEEKE